MWATDVTFTVNVEKSDNTTLTKDGITLTTTSGTFSRTDQYRIYSGATFTISSSVGNISKIVFTYNQNTFSVKNGGGSISNVSSTGTWTGDASSVSFSTVGGQVRVTSLTVTYTPAAPAHTITAVSNNDAYGTVSLTGTTITGSPKAGHRYATPAYTVTEGEATVSQTGNNFSVTPSTDCTVQINFEPIPTYTVTIVTPTGGTLVVKNGETTVASGDEIADGTTLTVKATPDEDHNLRNWQAVDATTHTYTAATSYTISGHDVTIKANFDEKVFHDAVFMKAGNVVHATVKTEEGQAIVFPNAPADYSEDVAFMGWVAETITGKTDEEPDFVTSANMGTSDVTFYACYADKTPGSLTAVSDELTSTVTGISGTTYTEFSGKTVSSNAVYAGKSAENKGTIQLRSSGSDSGIITTTSGGKVKKITVVWDSSTSSGRTLDIYGANVAYTAASELYNASKQGTKLGSIVNGTSTVLNVTGDYSYIGLRSNSGAMYLTKVTIEWETGTPDTYSGYCTTVAPDTRTAVNLTVFTADKTRLVVDETTATTVTNDQDDWTAAYTYASDDEDVATVDSKGKITAVAKGTAQITVTLNVDKDDADYKAGDTKSKSISIEVVNPSHTVTFYANGVKVSESSVEEGDAIDFPSAPSQPTYVFVGWSTAEIDGTQDDAPATVATATMSTADVTYYAVFAENKTRNVTATFDAATLDGLTEDDEYWEWTHDDTGIVLSISDGQRYTSGTPNTFSITKGTSNYFQIETTGVLKKVVVTLSGTSYKINSVTSGASLSTSTTTQTITFTKDLSTLKCYATSTQQIRATQIVVDAQLGGLTNYCTALPTTTLTIASACTDGKGMYYGTYSSVKPVIVPADLIVSEIYVDEESGELLVEDYDEGDVVPANTGVMVASDEPGSHTLTLAGEDGTSVLGTDNVLRATGAGITASAMSAADENCKFYRLTMHQGTTIGFYWGAADGAAFDVAANKAYMAVPKSVDVKGFNLFGDDLTDGILPMTLPTREETLYDLTGRRVEKPRRGIYIVNGKKVTIK